MTIYCTIAMAVVLGGPAIAESQAQEYLPPAIPLMDEPIDLMESVPTGTVENFGYERKPSAMDTIYARSHDNRYIGNDSCGMSGCHGADRHVQGSERISWLTGPHAKAWDVLLNEQSQQIAAQLSLEVPAHKASMCLDCHSVNAPADQQTADFAFSEGVSCEACHGAAGDWVDKHYLAYWKGLDSGTKAAYGMRPMDHATARVKVCAECHIGHKDKEVNHSLIAAGHPALNYEAAAFNNGIPKHWHVRDDKNLDPAYEARLWLAGQAVTAKYQMELIAQDASHSNWPDFTTFDCYTCHQSLKPNPIPGSQFNTAGDLRQPQGLLKWGTDKTNLLTQLDEKAAFNEDLAAKLATASNTFQLLSINTKKIAPLATQLQQDFGSWNNRIATVELDSATLEGILGDVTKFEVAPSQLSWKQAWQRYLAIRAIYRGWREVVRAETGSYPPVDAEFAATMEELAAALRFAPGQRSPANYDSFKVAKLLTSLSKKVSMNAVALR